MNLSNFRLPNIHLVRRFTVNASDCQKKNHYDCLGITPKATQGDVKSAYYKLSKEYHPDLNKENLAAAEKFRDITEAYEVLGNLKSRRQYDRGLFIRGGEGENIIYQEEPVADNLKYSSFYRHRNQPAQRRAQTDKTEHYNIDEWTKAHYSKIFKKSYDQKSSNTSQRTEEIATKSDDRVTWQVVSGLLLVVFAMLFHTPRTNFDISSSSEESPDSRRKT